MKVPEGPGLGVELDKDAVARYSALSPKQWPRHLSVVSLSAGLKTTIEICSRQRI